VLGAQLQFGAEVAENRLRSATHHLEHTMGDASPTVSIEDAIETIPVVRTSILSSLDALYAVIVPGRQFRISIAVCDEIVLVTAGHHLERITGIVPLFFEVGKGHLLFGVLFGIVVLYVLLAGNRVLAVAGNDNKTAPIDHGLNRMPGVDLALDLVPGAIVV